MKPNELNWTTRTDIDARDIASALIEMENVYKVLMEKASALDMEATTTRMEAEGMEAAIDIVRTKLELALNKIGENNEANAN